MRERDATTDGPLDGAGDAGGETDRRRHEMFAQYVLPEIDVLLRVAVTLTHHHADAEDLVQDTLLRAFRASARFDGAHPRAWLMTILRNTHLNRVRIRRPELLREPGSHDADQVTWPGAAAPASPEDLVVDPVFDETVAAALDALPEPFRSAVRLVDLDGLTYAEAAEALGVPTGTVMSRLHRGRARIRDHLVQAGQVVASGAAAAGSARTRKDWRRGGRR